MKTFTFAGTARDTDGKIVFRATNRDGYANILAKEGKTDIEMLVLPHAMTKADAKAYIEGAAKQATMREKFLEKNTQAKATNAPAEAVVDKVEQAA
jgi:N-acetylmuramoyl-L-alanine amidase CwlA